MDLPRSTARRLFDEHVDWALGLARAFGWRFERVAEIGDFESWALMGLWKAALAYNPERGEFPHYAAIRVHGEMRDGLGTWDGQSRYFRRLRRKGQVEGLPPIAFLELSEPVLGDAGQVEPAVAEDELVLRSELRLLRRVVERFGCERTRALLLRHDFGGEELKDVARDLGFSGSRATRLRKGAFGLLRLGMEARA